MQEDEYEDEAETETIKSPQEETAKKIHQQLLEKLPGYLVPKLVREICGEKSKTPVF